MSQAPLTFTLTTGAEFVDFTEDAVAALATVFKGSAQPAGILEGQLWIDDSNNPTEWLVKQFINGQSVTVASIDPTGHTVTPYSAGAKLGAAATKDLDVANGVQGFNADILKADETDNLTVGYTTDSEALDNTSVTATVQPDIATEHLKELTVDANFTLSRGTSTFKGWCLIKATVNSASNPTMSLTNVTVVDGAFDGTDTTVNWIQYVHMGTTENARAWVWQES